MRNLGDARMVDARGGLTQAGKQLVLAVPATANPAIVGDVIWPL